MIHDKKVIEPDEAEETQEVTEQDQKAIDEALAAAQFRKRKEMETRGRFNNQN